MNSIGLTFRDYLSYVFSGTLVLLSIYLLDVLCNNSNIWNEVKDSKETISIIILIGGYYLGYISNVIMTKFRCKPYNNTLKEKNNTYKLNDEFIKTIKKSLYKKFKYYKLDNTNDSNILYLCWQDIQTSKHKGLDQVYRIISLRNFAISSILPFALLGITVMIHGYCYIVIGLLILTFSCAMCLSIKHQEENFVQSVYRIWYILNIANNSDKK